MVRIREEDDSNPIIITVSSADNQSINVNPRNNSDSVSAIDVSSNADLLSAKLAREWAIKTDGKVENEDYSSKYYAQISEQAAQAAETLLENVTEHVEDFVQFSDLAGVATSGSYSDLSDKPSIPPAQVNSDWNASSGVAEILNKPNPPIAFGSTDSAADDVEKIVSIPSIKTLEIGQIIVIKPAVTSTVSASTIKLNEFTAYSMRYNNAAITTTTDSVVWSSTRPSAFIFDGNYWVFLCHGADTDTTYSAMTTANGIAGTETTSRTVRADRLKQIIQGTTLTGLSTSTDSAVEATDSITVGIGKLQAQINNTPAVTVDQTYDASSTHAQSGTAISSAISDLANKDLSNLTSTGEKHFLGKPQITNCITEIPQDIKLELNNGVLTLKAGSKVYVPNGFEQDGTTRKFDVVTTSSDMSKTFVDGQPYVLYVINNGASLGLNALNTVYSGSSDTHSGWRLFYNTATNTITRYNGNDEVIESNCSLPVAIYSGASNVITTIDQVFNGFGYIGSTVFVLPNVKGLAPNGRNTDGTLKNTEFTVGSVLTNDAYNAPYLLNSSHIEACYYTNYAEQDEQPSFTNGIWFNPVENKIWEIQSGEISSQKVSCIWGTVSATWNSSTSVNDVNSISPKQTFFF